MNYLRQRQQTGPQKPATCRTNKPGIVTVPTNATLSVAIVTQGDQPNIDTVRLITLFINIPQAPGGVMFCTWTNVPTGPNQVSSVMTTEFTDHQIDTSTIEVVLTDSTGKIWAYLYARP